MAETNPLDVTQDNQGDLSPQQCQSLADHPTRIGRYRIEKVLGQGGFGLVYLAHDEQLDRPVAVKVPHARLISRPEDAETYLAEARTVANLDHPGIVPVHDVGSTDDCPCFVVSKYIEGTELSAKIKENCLPFDESVELVAIVAEALHYAHKQSLVHRDVKPSNILVGTEGRPFIVDFGLALREENVGKGPRYAGTPAYMSPEQARGEGHRVDGRSDIFSLGVVLYELLVGRQPFRGDSQAEVLQQVTSYEPRPLRQYDDRIPKELERICLKALSKRATDRYSTAGDLAEDLRCCLADRTVIGDFAIDGRVDSATPSSASRTPATTALGSTAAADSSTGSSLSLSSQPIKIVPKGLRSFDAHDADFFLELLPGPRDRNGLPESLRFWKTRIEEVDSDNTFSVGLIYGPSGCGKSSLVKAGLLPRLSREVIPLYIEATADETETRLLRGLRNWCPALDDRLDLKEALTSLRQGQGIAVGKKVLIVLDQFEQWLHARNETENSELVQGLRQCDGGHVQCIVMVRDDFWMAATRFMRELEVKLLEGENSNAVDLFLPRHAERVLTAYGRAFGELPESPQTLSRQQEDFVKQAVNGLATEGKVICVRLALFAEMMNGKPWIPATLREVGGTSGVGVTFLEETFSASTASQQHRHHQKAARAVLKALIPNSGANIKGQMKSHGELLTASSYGRRPDDFEDLIRILDSELRLITPTDPAGAEFESDEPDPAVDDAALTADLAGESDERSLATTYYQLAHDYLVPSLREWLTRKQKETRRGRAELRLVERSELWNTKPQNRHLSSLWEDLNIRLFTDKKKWTDPQRKMMRRAGQHHGFRTTILVVFLAAATFVGLNIRDRVVETQDAERAAGLVNALMTAEIDEVPQIIRDIDDYRQWADPKLKEACDGGDEGSKERLYASLALLPVEPGQMEYLKRRLLAASPEEVTVLRDALSKHKEQLTDDLWKVLEKSSLREQPQTLQAASALAAYDPDNERWEEVSATVSDALVSVNAVYLLQWMKALRPVRESLIPDLAVVYRNRDGKRSETEQTLATNILEDYAADQPETLADLLMDAEPKQFAALYPKLSQHRDEAATLLEGEIGRKLKPKWKDANLDPSWTTPDASLVRQIESGHGLVGERFAFCQTMRLDDFVICADALGESGYRPTRFRPFAAGDLVQAAAVWTRDGREWQMAHGLSAEEIRKSDKELRAEGFMPVDVAGYVATLEEGPVEHYAAAWVKRTTDEEDARMYVAVSDAEHTAVNQAIKEEGFEYEHSLQAFRGLDGQQRYCGTRITTGGTSTFTNNDIPRTYEGKEYPDKTQWDIDISHVAGTTRSKNERHEELDKRLIDCRYSAIWQVNAEHESAESHGLSPKDHIARCQELLAQGYRPVAISVAAIGEEHTLVTASVWHQPLVSEDEKEALAKRQATAAVALMRLGQVEEVWPLLKHSPEPRVRSWIIHRFGPLGADPEVIVNRIADEPEVSTRRALILSLGEYDDVFPADRESLTEALLDLYRDDPDPGIHGAAEWALRHWGLTEKIKDIDDQLATGKVEGERRRYINGQGHTMVIIPGPVEFLMGSPASEPDRRSYETLHRRRIGRTYAIATKEVTVEQFQGFLRENSSVRHTYTMKYAPEPSCPQISVTWYEAAAYCRWLSEKEGIPEDQMCYPPVPEIKEGMRLPKDYLQRTGYRLPTEAEWEYASRAGASASRYYGSSGDLLGKYAWYNHTANDRTWPVASLKPNDLGLFDMQGNVREWCQNRYASYPTVQRGSASDDAEDTQIVQDEGIRVLRGGAFDLRLSYVRSAYRPAFRPSNRLSSMGFRPARTYR